MKTRDAIAIVDFGGQYTHLIANRIRRLGVYSEIVPSTVSPQQAARFKGIILSGGPFSVLDTGKPEFDPHLLDLKVPFLGLCYGHQLMAQALGGRVMPKESREYGRAQMTIVGKCDLFNELQASQQIWMSHGDTVVEVPDGFEVVGSSSDCRVTAMADARRHRYGLQFHPEVTDTPQGMKILQNFLTVCGCDRTWKPEQFIEDINREIRTRCEGKKVFLLVSGGVDSTVCFALLNKALGPSRVLGLHIDNGLMRKGESEAILNYLKEHGFSNLIIEDASGRFLAALGGITDPEKKREIIGAMFLSVKQLAEQRLGLNINEWLLGQGTIYPDTIESAGSAHADKIKTHHNRVNVVLELIEKGLVIEPLSQLYKDEVRLLGEKLGLPPRLVWRHPFPGPGLGVRVLCSATQSDRVDGSLEAEVTRAIAGSGYTARVLPIKSVGVQGDARTYAHPALLDGPCDWDTLARLSTAITNKIAGVNRVLLRIRGYSPSYRLVEAYMTKKRLDTLREIDHLVKSALVNNNEYHSIWQMPVVLLPLINEAGNESIVLRPVNSQEAMTARFASLKQETLQQVCDGVHSIAGAGDLFYDITHKPPGTIEWE
ncbi:MAG: glutamine-hydrolyzing GMP synthase [Chitinivibrionales bacterium]|nr:glutamine-hydrolyzing GMP synthase [Chitinivibrionales bacterium]